MAKRSEKRDKAYELWLNYKGDISLKNIAARLDVSDSLIRKWKSLDHWSLDDRGIGNGNVTVKDGNVTKNINGGAVYGNRYSAGHGAPKGNKNSVGHRPSVPLRNHNAMKHGLYAKYLPKETFEIAQAVDDMSPLDILWSNICMKYAAILRAQRIMNVKNIDDCTKHVVVDGEAVTSYSYQEAWDKQGAFLQAQSRAMRALTDMIKQYNELCKSEIATEEQRLRIEKLRAEVDAMANADHDERIEINIRKREYRDGN